MDQHYTWNMSQARLRLLNEKIEHVRVFVDSFALKSEDDQIRDTSKFACGNRQGSFLDYLIMRGESLGRTVLATSTANKSVFTNNL